jgi:hypothetical protein
MEEARAHQQQLKKKDIYDMLMVKVQAIKDKNLPPEKWTVSKLNCAMVQESQQHCYARKEG